MSYAMKVYIYHNMNIRHDMKCYTCCLAKTKTQTQNFKILPIIDDQQPSSGSISVFLVTEYTINRVLSVYHIKILCTSCHDI